MPQIKEKVPMCESCLEFWRENGISESEARQPDMASLGCEIDHDCEKVDEPEVPCGCGCQTEY